MLFILAACNSASTTQDVALSPTGTLPSVRMTDITSTVSFTLSGGATGTYTLHEPLPISKLRHGHQEFTIDVNDGHATIFMAFIGYHGPDTYTLSEDTNGGDIHIALAQHTWDLSPLPPSYCVLTITSDTPITYANIDTPTAYTTIDRMKGFFSCPRLLSSNQQASQQPIEVSKGMIDIAIIVES